MMKSLLQNAGRAILAAGILSLGVVAASWAAGLGPSGGLSIAQLLAGANTWTGAQTFSTSVVANQTPLSGYSLDVANQAVTTVANGACTSAWAAGDGLVVITDQTNGDSIINLSGAGNVTVVASTGSHWASSPTASPTSGQESFVYSTGYKLCNNTGGSMNYIIGSIRTRLTN